MLTSDTRLPEEAHRLCRWADIDPMTVAKITMTDEDFGCYRVVKFYARRSQLITTKVMSEAGLAFLAD